MAIGDKKPVVMGSDLAAPGGVAALGEDGVLSEGQRPDAEGVGAIPAAEKGRAGGVATLDGEGKLNSAQRPDYGISQVSGLRDALEGKQATLAFDAEPTEGSDNPVKSGGVYDALSKKQGALTGAPGQLIGIGDDGAAAAAVYPSNPNLLDNWYLLDPINQRGKTEYANISGYTIDRWRNAGTTAILTLTDDGLHFVSTAGLVVRQTPDNPSQFAGKVMTISLLSKHISGRSGCRFRVNETRYDSPYVTENGIHLTSTTLKMPDNIDSLFFEFFNMDAGEQYAIAMKVEPGPVQTLAHKEGDEWVLNDPPPNKALELAKCQRYLQRVSGSVPCTTNLNGAFLDAIATYRVSMREKPTFTGSILNPVYLDGVSYPVENFTFSQVNGDTNSQYAFIRFSCADELPAMKVGVISAISGWLNAE